MTDNERQILEVLLSGDPEDFLKTAAEVCERRAEYGACGGGKVALHHDWELKERYFKLALSAAQRDGRKLTDARN
jgi:hypothetical protein